MESGRYPPYWVHHHHHHPLVIVHSTGSPSDTWLNVVLGIAAIATVIGVLISAGLALRYGRKATVSVKAKVHEGPAGTILACRALVKAVGIFRVKFHETEGAVVRATELYMDANGVIADGRYWELGAIFKGAFVEAGEELPTSVVFSVPSPTEGMIGWRVSLEIATPDRWFGSRPGWSWADQIFVPAPRG